MYEFGILVAFVLWIHNCVVKVANANSQLARNLAKVDMHLSWWTAQPEPISDYKSTGERLRSALLPIALGLVGTLLSWLSVAYSVSMFLYQQSKASGTPRAVKELQWKLRNVDMTREQIRSEMAAMHDVVASRVAPSQR